MTKHTPGLVGSVAWTGDELKAENMLKQHGTRVKFHVSEIHSPPRVSAMAEKMGLVPGVALDLTTVDPDDNVPCDFNNIQKRNKARIMIIDEKGTVANRQPNVCNIQPAARRELREHE